MENNSIAQSYGNRDEILPNEVLVEEGVRALWHSDFSRAETKGVFTYKLVVDYRYPILKVVYDRETHKLGIEFPVSPFGERTLRKTILYKGGKAISFSRELTVQEKELLRKSVIKIDPIPDGLSETLENFLDETSKPGFISSVCSYARNL